MTILPDGRRRSAMNSVLRSGAPKIVIVGGSFVQGWAVSDQDTFAWKLQDRFADYDVLNLGTAGYGTYQSLLLIEDLFAGPPHVSLVICGTMTIITCGPSAARPVYLACRVIADAAMLRLLS